MQNDETACSNCACPLNYDCDRFKQFFDGRYSFVEEYKHNDDYSCDHKREGEQQTATVADSQQTFF